MVCVDSGKTKLFKFNTRSGLMVARKLLTKIMLQGVVPSILHSDNAPEFIHGVVEKINILLGIKGVSGTPYKPSVQGKVENRNKTVATLLSWMCNDAKDDWDLHLGFVEGAIWKSVNTATGLSPAFYETGFDPITPFDCQIGLRPEDKSLEFDQWKTNLDLARGWAMQHLELSGEEMRGQYDTGKKPHKLEAGQEVFVFWPKKGKLEKQWHGPYVLERFIDIDSKRAAIVAHKDQPLDRFVVHVDRLTQRHAPTRCKIIRVTFILTNKSRPGWTPVLETHSPPSLDPVPHTRTHMQQCTFPLFCLSKISSPAIGPLSQPATAFSHPT